MTDPRSAEPTANEPTPTQNENASREESSVEHPSSGADRKPSGRLRWKFPAALLIAAIAIQIILWMTLARDQDQTFQIMSVYYIWPATLFTLLQWWTFASGLSWRTRKIGIVGLAGSVGMFFLLFRHDGYYGNLVPRFSPRWTPSPQERAERFWNEQAQSPEPIPTPSVTSSPDSEEPALAEVAPLEVAPDDWTEFRGPQRDGIVRNVRLARDWDRQPPRLVWKHPVGLGWSSFAIAGDLAFTQEQRGDEEMVVCYSAETGEQIWTHADRVHFSSQMGGDGPRATPTVHDSRLYVLGGTGILNCLEARTGRLLWSRNILDDADAENLGWGMAGSPLVFDDKVVVNPGGRRGKGVAAYHRLTGELLWANGRRHAGYTAPRLETIHGVRQILIFDGEEVAGYAPDDGRQLWAYPWKNTPRVNAAQPIVHNDAVFISSGYGIGSALLDLVEQGGEWAVEPNWITENQFKLKFNDAVLHEGSIYGLDEGILSCIDIETGKRKWKRGRYGYGQLLLIDDLLLVQAESGDVALVEANPEQFRELTRFQPLDSMTWNHPVLHRGRLYVRNAEEAACYELPLLESSPSNLDDAATAQRHSLPPSTSASPFGVAAD